MSIRSQNLFTRLKGDLQWPMRSNFKWLKICNLFMTAFMQNVYKIRLYKKKLIYKHEINHMWPLMTSAVIIHFINSLHLDNISNQIKFYQNKLIYECATKNWAKIQDILIFLWDVEEIMFFKAFAWVRNHIRLCHTKELKNLNID